MAFLIWALITPAKWLRIKAARPATCGVADEVPLNVE